MGTLKEIFAPSPKLPVSTGIKRVPESEISGRGLNSAETLRAIPKIEGDTDLHHAVRHGYYDVVEKILEGMYEASGFEGEKAAKSLRQMLRRVGVNNENNDSPLHLAVASQRNDIIALLVNNGANVDHANLKGETPRGIAIAAGEEDIIDLVDIENDRSSEVESVVSKTREDSVNIGNAHTSKDVARIKVPELTRSDSFVKRLLGRRGATTTPVGERGR
jgi:hypothetical protein